ncbi:MAG: tRNA (adenosine(37)-N6)-threonylcarbamoyltransferase complex ATPase subunit type 1 TsaE [Armatimonadetes bacterium]|nr:tRNA (adenosine(37)-N6)-threonylcarbamoyltransferase complex ATPase subunit type 1 TsaE [Armatimonadota bacterium]
MTIAYLCKSPEGTQAVAEALASSLRPGDLIALIGPLGAGKTCFVAGLARGLGVEGRVASPSFIVARYHPGPRPLLHADAYRLASPAELVEAGLDEYLGFAVVAVEWADRVVEVLPADRLEVRLTPVEEGRRVELVGTEGRGLAIVEERQHDPVSHRDVEPAG